MSKHLSKLLNSSNYKELVKVLESKPGSKKYVEVSEDMLMEIKNSTRAATMKHLYDNKSIPESLLKLNDMLGDDFSEEMKSRIISFIVSHQIADIAQFISINFKSADSLKEIFSYIEKSIENIYLEQEYISSDWNIDAKLLSKSLIMIKQVLCQYFYNNEVNAEEYCKGLLVAIGFEYKLSPFFDIKKCCQTSENLEENGMKFHGNLQKFSCIHKNMISSVFTPYLHLFFSRHLQFKEEPKNNNILDEFVLFFTELEFVYNKIDHLDNKSSFLELFEYSDKILYERLASIPTQQKLEEGIRIISTLIYIEEFMEEYLCKISETVQLDLKSRSLEMAQKLEKFQSLLIEKQVGIGLEFVKNKTNIFEELKAYLDYILKLDVCNSQEIRSFILEIVLSQLLTKITARKMNISVANIIYDDMLLFEEWLKSGFAFIPHIKTIQKYLKIFTFTSNRLEDYIQNFEANSENKFCFEQILKALEDQKLAHDLYSTYKKMEIN